MKRYIVSLCVVGLAACAPLKTYYKPGAPVALVNRDTTDCQVKALRDVPVSTQIRRLPPEYVPPRRICDPTGANCRQTRGYYIPGEIVTFDPNDGLRKRVETQCMADKGYVPVSIPQCPDRVAKAAPSGATQRFPTLSDASCVIRNRDGTFQIVTQG